MDINNNQYKIEQELYTSLNSIIYVVYYKDVWIGTSASVNGANDIVLKHNSRVAIIRNK